MFYRNLFLKNLECDYNSIHYIEKWDDIAEFEGLYQCSTFGRIKSFGRNGNGYQDRILKQRIDRYGYLTVGLVKKQVKYYFTVHRIIAKTFLLNSEDKPQVNHKKGIKTDNRVIELEWVTSSEDALHAHKIGLKSQVGEKNAYSVITNDIAIKIFNSKGTHIKIGEKFGVSRHVVQNIKTGNAWVFLTGKKHSRKDKKLTKPQIICILESLEEKRYLSEKYNIDESTVRYIKNGRRYSKITGIIYKKNK